MGSGQREFVFTKKRLAEPEFRSTKTNALTRKWASALSFRTSNHAKACRQGSDFYHFMDGDLTVFVFKVKEIESGAEGKSV